MGREEMILMDIYIYIYICIYISIYIYSNKSSHCVNSNVIYNELYGH